MRVRAIRTLFGGIAIAATATGYALALNAPFDYEPPMSEVGTHVTVDMPLVRYCENLRVVAVVDTYVVAPGDRIFVIQGEAQMVTALSISEPMVRKYRDTVLLCDNYVD